MSAWLRVDGDWRHRPWWKVAVNTALRFFQRGPRKFVIYTRCDDTTSPPTVTGYGFGRVLHL